MTSDEAFDRWLAAAEARYLADLMRREVGRALRALSSCYVERREKLTTGHALEGRGKRAAFALYYGPLHFLTVREIAREAAGLKPCLHTNRSGIAAQVPADLPQVPAGPQPGHNLPTNVQAGLQPCRSLVIDIGCGTGAAGAAWALETGAEVRGFDVSAWAVGEANWTYQALGVRGRAQRGRIEDLRLPREPATLLAAFVINELNAVARQSALDKLVAAATAGHQVVVVEPIARGIAPWWSQWRKAFEPLGGETRDWRARVDLPPILRDFDKAAGLRHRELTARTLVVLPANPNI